MELRDYIQGRRHGKEANQLEQKAMNDPFLQDAIDGYDQAEGNHARTLDELEKRVVLQKKPRNKRLWIWSAAAILLLLIGTQLFVWILSNKTDIQLATAEKPSMEEIIVASSDSIRKTEKGIEGKKFADEKSSKEKKKASKSNSEKKTIAKTEIPTKKSKEEEKDNILITHKVIVQEEATHTKGSIPSKSKQISDAQLHRADNKLALYGRIVDETGEPLIGATISSKQTKKGTISGADGKFTMEISTNNNDTLIAALIGMETTQIPANKAMDRDIVLKSNDMSLNEMIIVGYGVQKKRNVTGVVSAAKAEKTATFGKVEFIEYFKQHYDKNLCPNATRKINAEFYINANGRPENITIKEIPCTEMETELKRLLSDSPNWSQRNKKIELKISL